MLCRNEAEKRKDAHDRATILESLDKVLKSGDKSLVGNKGCRQFLKTEGASRFAINESKRHFQHIYREMADVSCLCVIRSQM